MLYGVCYYPEHRNTSEWEGDLRLMKEAGMNALRAGEFAWKRLEPLGGVYDFEWLDAFVDIAGRYSIGLVLCPPMRTVPAWLAEQEPSIMLVTREGYRLEYASRYTFCINHPLLREKSQRLAAEMSARYGNDPRIIGWHLDNEIGDEPDCHCPICKAKWQQWLDSKYGSIEKLNIAWGTVFWGMEYDHFGQVPTPRLTKADYNPAFIQAWRQFRSDCNVEIARLLADAVRPHLDRSHSFISTNNQMLWNNRTDYYRMAKHLDVTGTNYYPPYGEQCRALELGLAVNRSLKKAPIHIYELRNEGHAILGAEHNTPAPGELERLTLHTIANGADGVFYFPWKRFPFGAEQNHGALTDFAGRPTRMYEECKVIGGKLQQVAPMLRGSLVVSHIAVLYDFQSRWHLEQPSGWTGKNSLYIEQINKLYRTVRKLGFNCDAVHRDGDFTAYKLLLVPMLPIVDDALVDKLQRFVDCGGVLLLHPMSGIKDGEAAFFPDRLHPGVSRLIGSSALETATSGANQTEFSFRDRIYRCGEFYELVHPQTAEVAGTFLNQWFEGSAAVTRQLFGNGQCWFIATFAGEDFYTDLIGLLCREIGLSPLLGITPPEHVEISMRRDAGGSEYTFILNGSSQEKEIQVGCTMTDIWSGEPIEGNVSLKPYGVRILTKKRSTNHVTDPRHSPS